MAHHRTPLPAPLSFSAFIEAALGPAQLARLDEAMRWGSLTEAQRLRYFADEEQPMMLELEQRPAPWKSHYSMQSSVLTRPAMEDVITRVQRWEGYMLDPQAAWRSGYINASRYYQPPYILGYMGRREVVYLPPEGPTAAAIDTAGMTDLADTSTATATATSEAAPVDMHGLRTSNARPLPPRTRLPTARSPACTPSAPRPRPPCRCQE